LTLVFEKLKTLNMANAKKKAKRYTAEQKKEILDFIEKQGRP